MSWGYKILVVYAIFIAGIMFLVFKSSSQKMDLVTSDYYGKELKYQQKIDETNRMSALSQPVTYKINENILAIQFPKDFSGKKLTGEAVLYCPSDENKDVTQSFSVQDSIVTISISSNNKGLHELHLTWVADGVSYYFETKIFI